MRKDFHGGDAQRLIDRDHGLVVGLTGGALRQFGMDLCAILLWQEVVKAHRELA